ncbi:hypothetical protein ALO68_102274 [Pseudomonas syringae pv. helianthi]|uniref:Uncharacterized protein n=3 Tax=Pseudomonas syringae group TaxID=136849 RepID=A0A0P9KDZ7_9PSED|nr:hypothetical protein ALO80_102297 [Pseudomonas caricapapayae]KPX42072.1 hypothetical protein ALO68_102274 [Pseudomonas syringae pv. helianthi]KPY86431.1 hypothetical protein ALO44_102156 [Pseudomonas syringae pv. tagetis]RMM09097.1 hypothetical protein ALQ84_102020 [Pseudomonas caricapapayae]RMR07853.1 hypothetical protein ALP93_101718 [Pseudomonas syringae pv. helianthi]
MGSGFNDGRHEAPDTWLKKAPGAHRARRIAKLAGACIARSCLGYRPAALLR